MSFKENLVKARGHLIIVFAIITASAIVAKLENFSNSITKENQIKEYNRIIFLTDEYKKLSDKTNIDLTEEEKKYAKIAWKYFENNYQKETGLVNSVDNYEAATFWDTGSYLLALVSAYKLDIIDKKGFDEKLNKILDSLDKIQLFEGKTPNKSYNTKTLKMVDYKNKESIKGIGSSSLDIGRIMIPFYIISINYPEFYPKINKIISRLDLSLNIKNGRMYALSLGDKGVKSFQEGRLGYEQYASKGLELLGYDLSESKKYLNIKKINMYGLDVSVDSRESKELGGKNYVLNEPYILDGLEFNWDQYSKDISYILLKIQEERFKLDKILTAVSEDNLDQSPYFAYNTIYNEGKQWNCITPSGKEVNEFKSISTKAVFGLHYLYNTEYTSKLIDRIKDNYDENKGWYAGIYEKTSAPNKALTSNTNAVILESLFYKKFGKLAKKF
ncbi:MAG: DUF3131 domain-containing protein [Candidatus Sericytochromatia bacterium]